MANKLIRVTESQKELIHWVENSENFNTIYDVLKSLTVTMVADTLTFSRNPVVQEKKGNLDTFINQYINDNYNKALKIKEFMDLIEKSNKKPINARGRTKTQ